MNEITLFLVCVAWFVFQLLLCFKVKNRHIRRIPVYFHIVALALTVEWYFDVFDIHTGWDELGAIIVGIIIGCSGVAVVIAWVIYYVYRYFKNKKSIKTE